QKVFLFYLIYSIFASDFHRRVGLSGCGAVRLAYLLWEQGVAGSNPATPTKPLTQKKLVAFWVMEGSNQYITYILESTSTGRLYIGSTNNLEDRLLRHNTGRNKYTKGKGPWRILYFKKFGSRSEAVQLEQKLKRWKRPDRIKVWIEKDRSEER